MRGNSHPWTAIESRRKIRLAEKTPQSPDASTWEKPPGPMIGARPFSAFGTKTIRFAFSASDFAAAGFFSPSRSRIAPARPGLVGCVARAIFWLAPPCVAPTSFSTSGYSVSLIFAPREFRFAWRYCFVSPDAQNGHDKGTSSI